MSSLKKQLELLVAITKDTNRYQIKEIIDDLGRLQETLSQVHDFVEQKINLKITGLQDIKSLQNALTSMSRTVGPVSKNLNSFFNNLNDGLNNINTIELIKFQNSIQDLFQQLQKISIGNLSKEFKDFVKSVIEFSKEIEAAIKPLQALENSIGSLEKRMQTSLDTFSRYVDLFKTLENASANAGNNIKGARTPVFKTAESDATALVGQYKKISTAINEAGVSLGAFAKNSALIKDAGFRETLKNDIKIVTKNYAELQGVVAKLDASITQLSIDEVNNAGALKTLRSALTQAIAEQGKLNQINKEAVIANEALARSEREVKDAHKANFDTLGGIIERQVKFVAAATALAASFDFVRRGFTSTYEILSEIQRILVVSRSDFLSTADTIKLLGNTIETFTTKTGESTKNVATVLKELGSAGLTTEQSVAALDSTLNNIIATDSSVTETTRLVASTYNILGNTVAGTSDQVSNFTRINDILARATNESSLELDQLVQALKFSLPAAKEAGLNFEDLVGILAQLADQGLKGGNAGRALRASLQQITKDAPAFTKAFNIDIPLDKPLQFLDIIQKFGDKIKGQDISTEELGTIFTRLGLRGADTFLLLGQGVDSVNKKISDLKNNSKGVAEIGANIKIAGPERQFAILEQNINKLSREIFKPLIEVLLLTLETVNKFAEKVKLIGEGPVFSFGAHLAVLGIALKVLSTAITFTIGSFAKLETTMISVTAVETALIAKTFTVAGAFSALSAALGIIGTLFALGAAIYYVASTYFDFLKTSELLKKELDEQRLKSQEVINENNKLADSYEKVSGQLRKNFKNYQEGLITYEEYLNGLNNISIQSREAGNVISAFGGNAIEAANAIDELAKSNREISKGETTKQLELYNKQLEISIEDFKKFKKELGDLNNNLQSKKSSGSANIGYIKDLEENIAKTKKKIQDLNNSDISIVANVTDKGLIKKIYDEIAQRKKELGDPTGIGTELNALPNILDVIKEKTSKITFDNANFSLKEFDGLVQQTTTGVEGLQKKLLFEFKVKIPDSFAKDYNAAIENAQKTVSQQQSGKSFLNTLNIEGLSDAFEKELKSLNVNPANDAIKNTFHNIISETDKLAKKLNLDTFDKTLFQVEEIEKVLSNIIIARQNELKAQRENAKTEEARKNIDIQLENIEKNKEKLATLVNGIRNKTLDNDKLQLVAAEEQFRIKEASLLLDKDANFLTKEAGKINRNIVSQISEKIAVQQKFVEESKKQYDFTRKTLDGKLTEEGNALKILQAEKHVTEETRKAADLKESLRITTLKIKHDLEDSNFALRTQIEVGSDILDQDYRKLEFLEIERKRIEDRKKTGIEENIIKTDLAKIEKDRLATLQQINKETTNNLLTIQSSLFAAREELSPYQDRLKIIDNIASSQLEVLRIQKQIQEASNQKDAQNTIVQLENKKLNELTKQARAYKDLNKLQFAQLENAEKLLDLNSKIVGKQLDLFTGQKEKVGEGLNKLFEKSFEKNDFQETFKLGRALNLSLSQTVALLGDSAEKTYLFNEALKNGKGNFSEYDDVTRRGIKSFIELNNQTKEFRKNQTEINKNKFNLFETAFTQAVQKNGKEAFNQASSALESLIGLSDVYNEKGEIDQVRTLENQQKILKFQEQIGKVDVTKTGLEEYPKFVDAITTSINKMTEALSGTTKELKEMESVGFTGLDAVVNGFKEIINANTQLQSKFLVPVTRNAGGLIPGSGNGDTVPAMLTPGEFVIPAGIVKKLGVRYFYDLIGGQPKQKFAMGGLVRAFADGGIVGDPGDSLSFSKKIIEGQNYIASGIDNTNEKLDSYFPTLFEGIKYIPVAINTSIEKTNRILSDRLFFISEQLNREDVNFSTLIAGNVRANQLLSLINDNSENIANNIAEENKIIASLLEKTSSVAQAVEIKTEVAKLAVGGSVPGSGSGDIIPALLTPGEFVIPKRIVQQKGLKFFEDLIGGSNPVQGRDGILRLAGGGIADAFLSDNNVRDFSGTVGPDSKVDQINKSNKALIESKNIVEELIKKYHELDGTVKQFYDALRDNLNKIGQQTSNVFLKISVNAANKFLDSIENIGDTISNLFLYDLPSYLDGFVKNVVLSNVKILTDYKKQRVEISKQYKNQRADLIEQLKRNEISYFDFFDHLEDLNKDTKKKEIEEELKKNEALQKNFQETVTNIANQIQGLVSGFGSAIGNAFAGLPALVNPFIESIAKSISGSLGGVGTFVGGALGLAGNIIGPVIGAAGQLFSIAFQGFSSLIPLVTEIVTAPQAEFEQFLSSIKEIPAELDKILFGFTDAAGVFQSGIIDRIPKIADALAENIIPIGKKFAEAIDKVFPLIATAFSKIIPAALFAVIPVIISTLKTIPDFLVSVFLSTSAQLPAFISLLIEAAKSFFDFFNTNLPRIVEGILGFAEAFVNTLVQYFESDGINQIATAFEELAPKVAGILSDKAPIIAESLSEGVVIIAESLVENAPQIGSGIIDSINKIIGDEGGGKLKSAFQALFEKLFEGLRVLLPVLVPILGTLFKEIFNLVLAGLKFGSQVAEVIVGLIASLIDAIPGMITTFIDAFAESGPDIINGILDSLIKSIEVIGNSNVFDKLFQSLFGGENIDEASKDTTKKLPAFIDKIVDFISSNAQKIADTFSKIFTPARVSQIVDSFLTSFYNSMQSTGLGSLPTFLQPILVLVKLILDNKDALNSFIGSIVEFGKKLFEFGIKIFSKVGFIISKFITLLSKPAFVNIANKFQQIISKIFEIFSKLIGSGITALFDVLTKRFEKLTIILDKIITLIIDNEVVMSLLIGTLDFVLTAVANLIDALGPLIDIAIPAIIIAIAAVVAFIIGPFVVAFGIMLALFIALNVVLDAIIFVLNIIDKYHEPILAIIAILTILGTVTLALLATAFVILFAPIIAIVAIVGILVVAFIALNAIIGTVVGIIATGLIVVIGGLIAIFTTLITVSLVPVIAAIGLLTLAFTALVAIGMTPLIITIGVLTGLWTLLISPMLALIGVIGAFIVSVLLAPEAITAAIVAIGLLIANFDKVKDTFNTLNDNFAKFIQGLIDSIPGAKEAQQAAQDAGDAANDQSQQHTIGSDQESFGFVKAAQDALPHFALGGLIGGNSGNLNKAIDNRNSQSSKDVVPIVAHRGEFVMNKTAVSKIGIDNLNKLNSGRNVNLGSIGKSPFASSGGAKVTTGIGFGGGNISTVFNPPSRPNQSIPSIPENANTRDFYLKNFYNPGNAGVDSGINLNKNSPDSGISGSNIGQVGSISKIQSGPSISAKDEDGIKVEKIEINIDLSGSNFTSEDVAEKVKKSIVDSLDNNQGEISVKIRNMMKDKK